MYEQLLLFPIRRHRSFPTAGRNLDIYNKRLAGCRWCDLAREYKVTANNIKRIVAYEDYKAKRKIGVIKVSYHGGSDAADKS